MGRKGFDACSTTIIKTNARSHLVGMEFREWIFLPEEEAGDGLFISDLKIDESL
jgi:hypothetical protein